MDAARVQQLLSVWELTRTSLASCRLALEAHGWEPAAALAALHAAEETANDRALGARSSSVPPAEVSERSLARLLATYKTRARELRDVSEGTLPRSLVWVTDRATRATPIVAHWERHRYFLGAPMCRWFPERRGDVHGPLFYGGFARIEAVPTYVLSPEQRRLGLHDARWIMGRLTQFSARTGTRFAVALCGHTGWIDGDGCDATLREASASDPLDARTFADLLDRDPDRRTGVADCGWAANHEASLLHAAEVLRDVDVVDEREPAVDEVLAAIRDVTSSCVHTVDVARVRYRAHGAASFTVVLDRLLLERGASVIGAAWREVSRAEAGAALVAALTTSLAYGLPLLDTAEAERLAASFVATFEADALFFRNGDDSVYMPVLGTTFEKGVAVVDGSAAGLFVVGDED